MFFLKRGTHLQGHRPSHFNKIPHSFPTFLCIAQLLATPWQIRFSKVATATPPIPHALLAVWHTQTALASVGGGGVYVSALESGLTRDYSSTRWCYVIPKTRSEKVTRLPSGSLRTLVLGTQPPCCEGAQATRRGHVWVLQLTAPAEFSGESRQPPPGI